MFSSFTKTIKKVFFLSVLFCGISILSANAASSTISILDYGVLGDGVTDITEQLNQAIVDVVADSSKVGVYFPEGTYIISGSVELQNGVSLIGDQNGVSLLKSLNGTAKIGNTVGGQRNVNNIKIRDLFFYNVNVHFYCWIPENRKKIHINRCVFYGGDDNVVGLSRASQSSVRNCIFLRSAEFPGSGIHTWHSSKVYVENNVFGLSFSNMDWLNTEWKKPAGWKNLLARLSAFQAQEQLDDNQGCFRRAIKIQNSDGLASVYGNILNADRRHNGPRDHAMYIHNNSKKVIIAQNWLRGWVNDPSGGLKVRNNNGPTIIAANRFKDISIIGYIHRTINEGGFDNQEVYINTLVYRNIFDFDYDNPCYGGIGMWDQASEKGGQGVESGNEYAENVMNTPNNTARFWFRSADAAGHKIYNTNYDGDGNIIGSSNQNFPVVSGAPEHKKIKRYINMEIPDLVIPDYE